MNFLRLRKSRVLLLLAALLILIVASTRMRADSGSCGGATISLPFTDVPSSNIFFCSIASAYFSGLTAGTSATTYSPGDFVTREQMAAFITRTQDSALKRGSRRAALQEWWTPQVEDAIKPVGGSSQHLYVGVVSDGESLWAADSLAGEVCRRGITNMGTINIHVQAVGATGIISAAGRIFVTGAMGASTSGKVYYFHPQAPDGGEHLAYVFADSIGINPVDITCDGTYLWTADVGAVGGNGSVSRIRLSDAQDATFTAGFVQPSDILWDGANLWVADSGDNRLKRVDTANGAVLQSIAIGDARSLMFDGTNIWVSDFGGDTVRVVRAGGGLRGTVLATLTGNGMDGPNGIAFDGERVLVCNTVNKSLSLFKATDFTPLGHVFTPNYTPYKACSDGLSFFISCQRFDGGGSLLRF
jgi:hypothetical protein